MGSRSIFLRSPLGARVRSPLGVFKASVTRYMEIFTVPVNIFDGETHDITGELFGSVQGSGKVEIGDNPFFDSSTQIIEQGSIGLWSDDLITFTVNLASGFVPDTVLFIKVTNDDGETDVEGTYTGGLVSVGSLDNKRLGPFQLQTLYPNERYCVFEMAFDMLNEGYGPEPPLYWMRGIYLVGDTSGNQVYLGPISSSTDGGAVYWPLPGGIFSFSNSSFGSIILAYDVLPDANTPCASSHGWSNSEDVYLIPEFPLTLQITSHSSGDAISEAEQVTLSAYSYSKEGDASSTIAWDWAPTAGYEPIGVGGNLSVYLAVSDGSRPLRARNFRNGTPRYDTINITVEPFEISGISPTSGDEAGGTSITMTGTGFTPTMSVAFGGNPVTSFVFNDINEVQFDAPAGTGTVDVVITEGSFSDTLENGFTYTAGGFSVDSILPTSGTSAGGTAFTITGSGFVGPALVAFGSLDPGDQATSVVVVNDTTITGVTPAGTGTVDVIVADFGAGEGGGITNGYTYT